MGENRISMIACVRREVGTIWARRAEEFDDGRFQVLPE